ncbi:hypothetical protein Mal4_24910 [Maioricimonas rarisocia]|uniref:Aspartate/glutamate/uridylate kinase domain-containing protein n=1 Tax=Maioricimonas rarisocia TaxID=2528026 RepID=A0A517Z6Q3_9PLAN|nr:hypothetical protein [Maioricimonas rarisocia]QDU38168.1 hypothetical protein Mal4_24910 [Maioricimonas rarisocia]
MTEHPPWTLFKIGGSLFDLPDLRERLQQLLELRSGRNIAMLAGGGAAADLVRMWDRRFWLSAPAAHWLAIRAMGLNAGLLAHLIPGGRFVSELRELESVFDASLPAVLDPEPLLRHLESPPQAPLPESWDVTSDTIAAHLAAALTFDELVLVKSCEPAAETVEGLVAHGQVDPMFSDAARPLPQVGWANLRAEQLQIRPVSSGNAR